MSRILRALIVDDEALARETIRVLLGERDDVEVVGECEDGPAAVEAIRSLSPDIVFLDIQMPGLNGFGVVEEIGADNMPIVIFVTAYDQYALKAFDANAVDYLLKPFDDDRFARALKRAAQLLEEPAEAGKALKNVAALLDEWRSASQPERVTRFMIKERDSMFFVQAADIDYIEAAGDYVELHVDGRKHLMRETMRRLEEVLDPNSFVRIHRSTIVNLNRIKELRPYFHGDYVVYLNDGTELKLSRRYWSRLEGLLA
ncbi:MAG: LytTR family DNA-binding domain-containing protein [Bacteroidota bacterium]